MNKDKQIDMITELLIDFDEMGFAPTTLCPDPEAYAIEWRKKLTEELKGYRKSDDVAREIFEEIESISSDFPIYGNINTVILSERDLAFIKKKYTEDGE